MSLLIAAFLFWLIGRLDETSPGFTHHRGVEFVVGLVLLVAVLWDLYAHYKAWL